jgi:capsular exopolysaccharide synthesis family protein
MSRVDEAMRRATEEARGVPSAAAADAGAAALGDQHTDALAREPFPTEMPERRQQVADARRLVPQLTTEPAGDTTGSVASSSGLPVDRFNSNLAEKLVVDPRIPAGSREQYRRLAAILHDAQAVSGLKVVMIASAVAGEGKTLTAVNLALTLSGSYRKRVLLIDADLRRPAMHQVFRIDASQGLTDGLEPASEAKLVVRQVTPTLSVLPAGRPTADPMAALISERMRRLIEEARETFEWVIIDTPPLVLLPDANLLASMVDGAVLVIKAASTSHELSKRAVEAIGRPRIVGVVLNRATESSIGRYGGYDDYYYHYANAHPRE